MNRVIFEQFQDFQRYSNACKIHITPHILKHVLKRGVSSQNYKNDTDLILKHPFLCSLYVTEKNYICNYVFIE